ncbi:MAG TPA: hypothetical protein VIC31_11940, partial [Rudaea sp.]
MLTDTSASAGLANEINAAIAIDPANDANLWIAMIHAPEASAGMSIRVRRIYVNSATLPSTF